MNAPNLSWIFHLPEVGSPIRDKAQELEWYRTNAETLLAEAKQRHAESMKHVAHESERLLREITKLWTDEEIKTAKEQKPKG